MADHSKIEWTDATWNPITGCAVVSPGCTNCYAMKLAGTRLAQHPSRAGLTRDSKAGPVWTGEVRLNEEWLALAERCAEAEGPDAILDEAIARAAYRDWGFPIPPHTASLDHAAGLIYIKLPGWAWRVASCHVSDDAWLVPDYNDPAHGDRLRAELGEPRSGHWTDDGIYIDRRPPGNPALALCEAFCRAMAEKVK